MDAMTDAGSAAAIVIRPPLSKTLATLASCVGFTAIGAVVAYDSDRSGFVYLIGLATIIVFGASALGTVYRLARRTPSLVIDERGITDCAEARSVGLIRWEEIARIQRYTIRHQEMLGLYLNTPESVLARIPYRAARTLRNNLKLGLPPVNISAASVAGGLASIEAIILARLAARCAETCQASSHRG